MPGFDWTTMLADTGVASQPFVIVAHPSALTGTAKVIEATPIATIREYLALKTIRNAAPLLSKAFVDENFAFSGTVLSGTPQLKDRWKRGVDLVNGSMGEAVGEVYVARYFPPAAKAKRRFAGGVPPSMQAVIRHLARRSPRMQASDAMLCLRSSTRPSCRLNIPLMRLPRSAATSKAT